MPSKKKERWVVTVTTKDAKAMIGIVGVFASKKKAESWIAATPDLANQNDREVWQLLDPE